MTDPTNGSLLVRILGSMSSDLGKLMLEDIENEEGAMGSRTH